MLMDYCQETEDYYTQGLVLTVHLYLNATRSLLPIISFKVSPATQDFGWDSLFVGYST